MIEALADVNEDIMEKYLGGEEISKEEIPVVVSFKPIAAAISPENTSEISLR